MTDIAELLKSYGLEGDETLTQKWARESRAERARLRALSRDELEAELESCGVQHELVAELMSRIR